MCNVNVKETCLTFIKLGARTDCPQVRHIFVENEQNVVNTRLKDEFVRGILLNVVLSQTVKNMTDMLHTDLTVRFRKVTFKNLHKQHFNMNPTK